MKINNVLFFPSLSREGLGVGLELAMDKKS